MALQEDFEKSGNWLFRWRSYLPLILAVLIMIALLDYDYPGQTQFQHFAWEAFCFVVSLFGLAIRVFTVGHTPSGTSGRNTQKQVADSLNTTGIYSLVRNPLYLGNFFMGLGIALFACFWWLALIYALIFWLYHERIIYAEEAFLRKKFGDTYLAWTDKTPVFIPKFSGYIKSELPFSVKTAISREANSFFAVVVLMTILESVSNAIVTGHAFLDKGWWYLLGISFVVWMLIRVLRKFTNVFDVEGR